MDNVIYHGPMWGLFSFFEARRVRRVEHQVLKLTRNNRGALERALTSKRRLYPTATRLQLLRMVQDDYSRDYSR